MNQYEFSNEHTCPPLKSIINNLNPAMSVLWRRLIAELSEIKSPGEIVIQSILN